MLSKWKFTKCYPGGKALCALPGHYRTKFINTTTKLWIYFCPQHFRKELDECSFICTPQNTPIFSQIITLSMSTYLDTHILTWKPTKFPCFWDSWMIRTMFADNSGFSVSTYSSWIMYLAQAISSPLRSPSSHCSSSNFLLSVLLKNSLTENKLT